MVPMEGPAVQIDAGRARAYVLAHGDTRARARLEGIFGAVRPDREVVRTLEALQNSDGGFPLRQEPGGASSVETTCYMLAQLKDLPPLAGSPMASRALAFLRRCQNPDGSWQEPGHAAGYLTANAAFTLLTMEPAHLDPVARGEFWLRNHSGQGQPETYAPTLALACALWYKLQGAGSQEVAAAYHQVSVRQWTAPELAWWLSGALEAGVGGRYLVPVLRMLAHLASFQEEDGAWPAEDGYPVETTLQALRIFRGYGLV